MVSNSFQTIFVEITYSARISNDLPTAHKTLYMRISKLKVKTVGCLTLEATTFLWKYQEVFHLYKSNLAMNYKNVVRSESNILKLICCMCNNNFRKVVDHCKPILKDSCDKRLLKKTSKYFML